MAKRHKEENKNNSFEKSCGAVVFKIEDGNIYYLVEKMKAGHYSFPKGHVEKKETEDMTALREIKEEVGIDVWLDLRHRFVITYTVKNNVRKDNVYFVAKYLNGNIEIDESEVIDAKWYSESEVIDLLKSKLTEAQIELYKGAFSFIKENYLI